MHINPVSFQTISYTKFPVIYDKQKRHASSPLRDEFIRSKRLSFRGIPEKLDYSEVIPKYTYGRDMTASRAIKIHEELKKAKYLDIGQRSWFHPYFYDDKNTRLRNLSFLNFITKPKEKEKFVKYYMDLTGFPNLAEVSKNIENELVRSALQAMKNTNKYGKVIAIGYNDTCSVGEGLAFPGSDIDGAYIIIDDSTNIDKFKSQLWDVTDSRILSYNHPAAFPQVYSLSQLKRYEKEIDEIIYNRMRIFETKYLPTPFWEKVLCGQRYTTREQEFKDLIGNYNSSYIDANLFYIDLVTWFPNDEYTTINREAIKNFGFFAETFLRGKKLYNGNGDEYQKLLERAKNRPAYYLANLSQIAAIKNRGVYKPKLEVRKNFAEQFNGWTIDKQYDFIRTLIMASCTDNEENCYPEYFRTGPDQFKPMLSMMGERES